MLKFCTNLLRKSSLLYNQPTSINSKQCLRLLRQIAPKNVTNIKCYLNRFSSTSVGRNQHLQGENSYAHNVIQTFPLVQPRKSTHPKNPVYNEQQFKSFLNRDWRGADTNAIIEAFHNVLGYCNLHNITVADTSFDKLVDGLMDKIENLTKPEIVSILEFLVNMPSPDYFNSHNYHDMWSALDDACCWKMYQWDNATLMEVAELWYKLSLGKQGDYIFQMLNKFSKKPERLPKAELLHVFFYMNVCRKRQVDFEFQEAVSKLIDTMDVNEMGIVAMAFFKTQTTITNITIMEKMIEAVKKQSSTIHEISLAAILKILRFSQTHLTADQIYNMLNYITPEVPRLSIVCCLHIALVGTRLQMLHEPTLKAVTERIAKKVDDVREVRIKEIERLLLALSMFDYTVKTPQGDIYDLLLRQLYNPRRAAEKVKYPTCVFCSMSFLAVRNIYPEDMISEVLDLEYIKTLHGKNPRNIPRELFALDLCIEIERPNYNGNRLPAKTRYTAAKWMVDYLPKSEQSKMSSGDRLMFDVIRTCEIMTGGSKFLHVGHILPHFSKADIVLCYDKKLGQFVEPTGFENYTLGDIVRPHSLDKFKWFIIVPNRVNTTIRYFLKPIGLVIMKERQLRKVGYEPIVVPYHEYLPLDSSEKVEYILNKIRLAH